MVCRRHVDVLAIFRPRRVQEGNKARHSLAAPPDKEGCCLHPITITAPLFTLIITARRYDI